VDPAATARAPYGTSVSDVANVGRYNPKSRRAYVKTVVIRCVVLRWGIPSSFSSYADHSVLDMYVNTSRFDTRRESGGRGGRRGERWIAYGRM